MQPNPAQRINHAITNAADAAKAQSVMRFCTYMTVIYAVVFGAAAAYLDSRLLWIISGATLAAGAGYEWGLSQVKAGRLNAGVVIFNSSIIITLWIITYLLPEQSTTCVIASFIPFAFSLHFTTGQMPRVFAALAILTGANALVVRHLGWSSGFPPHIMAWLDVAGGFERAEQEVVPDVLDGDAHADRRSGRHQAALRRRDVGAGRRGRHD